MRKILSWVLGVPLAIGLLVYAVIGETGPIGWLNAAQQWAFGAYSRKMSMLGLMCVGLVLFALAVWVQSLFGGDDDARGRPPAPVPAGRPLPWALGCALGFVGAMALVWAAAYGYVWWDLRQRSADSVAVYEPVDLALAARPPGGGHEHLELRGRVLGDHVVSRTSGDSKESSQRLLPVVGRDWREGDPVHFVIRLDNKGAAALREALRSSPSLLVRTDGSVPTTALQVFAKMKSPIADDAVAVTLVATRDGRPAPVAQELDWSEAIVYAVVGSFAVTLGAFFMMLVPWAQRRRDAKVVIGHQRQAVAPRAAR